MNYDRFAWYIFRYITIIISIFLFGIMRAIKQKFMFVCKVTNCHKDHNNNIMVPLTAFCLINLLYTILKVGVTGVIDID